MHKFCIFQLPLFLLAVVFAACGHYEPAMPVLNEICGKDADGLEWVEVGNPHSLPVNLKGYKLRKMDEEGFDKKVYEFPDTILAPGALYVVNTEYLRTGLPRKKSVVIELEDPTGEVIDSFDSLEDLDLEGHPVGASYSRYPDLTGEWILSPSSTWNEPNLPAEQ